MGPQEHKSDKKVHSADSKSSEKELQIDKKKMKNKLKNVESQQILIDNHLFHSARLGGETLINIIN